MIRKSVAFGAGICLAAATLTPAAQAAPQQPALKLLTTVGSVRAFNYVALPGSGHPSGLALDLGAYVAAVGKPFELRVKRPSYAEKLTAVQIVNGKAKKLPAGTVRDWSGLPGFFRLTFTDAAGRSRTYAHTWCPSNAGSRVVPSGAPTNRYPEYCPAHPFALGQVWGIQAGWASNTASDSALLPLVKDGSYTVQISIAPKYQQLFGASSESKKVKVTVTTVKEEPKVAARRPQPAPAPQAAARPQGAPTIPKGPKPDLRSLPAWGIAISAPKMPSPSPSPGHPMRKAQRDYLEFAANVWNAGPSPLVVDGFRRTGGKGVMDAFQYFFDAKGKQVGFKKSGTFEWDPRIGHKHWHFTDFAAYRLLGADKKLIVRSQKEAFCLANTDAIDYTVKGADWAPDGTDLHTSCGVENSLSVREVLAVGSGDTYQQTLPGQSFDVTDLPNGTYYIQVAANPKGKLFESDTKNNVALRKVILGGTAGARTVKVPKVGLIDRP
ncbi:MAG: lysyl oxidase family protein [Streptosporangiaceae bacterium]